MFSLLLAFIGGWIAGLLAEYCIHRWLHKSHDNIHMRHHAQYHQLPARAVARMSLGASLTGTRLTIVLVLSIPALIASGFVHAGILIAGALVHLLVFYEICHFLFHDSHALPAWLRQNRLFDWWRRCHIHHHASRPKRNYSVSCPFVDMLFGTYHPPKDYYDESEIVEDDD